MDLAAATAPVGQVSAMLGNNLSGPMLLLHSHLFILPIRHSVILSLEE